MQTNIVIKQKNLEWKFFFSVAASINLASFFKILVLFSLQILQNLLIDGHLQ